MCDLAAFQQEFAAAMDTAISGPVAVYRNTAALGAIEALRDNYPVTRRLVGDEMFDAMALDHGHCCPPRSPVMALYGARFSDWIADQPWTRDIAYLPDVARIERLFVQSLFAADEPAATMADLEGVHDWTNLRLRLHPACHFDWFTSPAMGIWLAHQNGAELGEGIEWQAEGGLFTRPTHAVLPMSLDRATHRFLFGMRLGETVGASALATAAIYPEADLGALLTALVSAGAFAAPSKRRN